MKSETEIIELIKSGKSISEIIKLSGGIPAEYYSALRDLIQQDNVRAIMNKLAKNLPPHIFFRGELERLYHALTGKYIPSSYSIRKVIELIYENGDRSVLFKILRALAERGISELKNLQKNYPTLKNDLNRGIEELTSIIKEIENKDVKGCNM